MRIVKDAEERRNEILDAAQELFARKGFEGTRTNDILEKVGIARGTLYYHFESKEDIMDALIERCNNRMIGAAQKVASDKSIPVVERLARVILTLNMGDEGSEALMRHIHSPNNALMHQKIQRLIISGVTPILAQIIQEGIEQGLFNTPHPYECMEMIVAYITTVLDDNLAELSPQEHATKIQAALLHLERMLGVGAGSLQCIPHVLENKT